MSTLLTTCLFALLLSGGLLVPGWLLGRALRTPAGLTGALLGSAAIVFNLVLLLDAAGRPLDLIHLPIAVASVCLVLVLLGSRKSAQTIPTGARAPWRWQQYHWLFIPVAIGVAAMALRIIADPLSGWDTHFRWDFLARQIVRQGSLSYYPAVTSGDFLHYGWCDGIAPLVSTLYAWSYFSLGRIETWATTPVVLTQGVLLFYLVWQLSNRRHGPAAAAAACAILATSAVFLWGVAIGQETGLTALSLVAMFWFLEQHRLLQGKELVWAGLAAGTGALAREYGLVFIALGGLVLACRNSSRRDWFVFMGTAVTVVLPWYFRNWVKTGNPLYSHSVGQLFPVNPVYIEYNQVVMAVNSVTQSPMITIPFLVKYAAFYSGAPLILGGLGALWHWRQNILWFIAMAVIIILWLYSIGLTSGGYIYSMRVLTPAIAIGAVLGGRALADIAAKRHSWILALVLTVIAIDAGTRSLFLPFHTEFPWKQTRLFAWHEQSQSLNLWRSNHSWEAITEAAEGRKILVSDPALHAFLSERGDRPVPLFSPEVRFLFNTPIDFKASQAQLRAKAFRFVLITRNNLINDTQLARHPFFRELASTTPAMSTPLFLLYDLYPPQP